MMHIARIDLLPVSPLLEIHVIEIFWNLPSIAAFTCPTSRRNSLPRYRRSWDPQLKLSLHLIDCDHNRRRCMRRDFHPMDLCLRTLEFGSGLRRLLWTSHLSSCANFLFSCSIYFLAWCPMWQILMMLSSCNLLLIRPVVPVRRWGNILVCLGGLGYDAASFSCLYAPCRIMG